MIKTSTSLRFTFSAVVALMLVMFLSTRSATAQSGVLATAQEAAPEGLVVAGISDLNPAIPAAPTGVLLVPAKDGDPDYCLITLRERFRKTVRVEQLARIAQMSPSAFHVGYESASQFSRKYSRMFSLAPRRHAVASAAAVA